MVAAREDYRLRKEQYQSDDQRVDVKFVVTLIDGLAQQ